MNATAAILAAALAVNFSKETGRVRPELHSSGFGPTVCSQTEQDLADMKAMGFKYSRTHDWALVNANQRVCDYFHIFPLMHLDAKDPRNYVFGPTDYLLKRTREELGTEIFFRLGTSIEHSGKKVHFNSLIPEDFDKVAEIFAATVRHYNRGWADGFEWGIRYWEIWNEPDGANNMWCLPDGDQGRGDTSEARAADEMERETRRLELFARFFAACVKRIKGEFGDTVKVGGPALCSWRPSRPGRIGADEYFDRLFEACREAGTAPDFISWHGYVRDPARFNRDAEQARKLCDSRGLEKCELILNEWHYFGENYDWSDLRSPDPAVRAMVWEGPDGHNGIRSACFTLATLANLQRSKMDQAYFYGCSHTGGWGFKDEQQNKYKVFYALKLFGDIVKNYSTVCESSSGGSVTLFPVKDAAGRTALLAVDCGGASRHISVKVAGIPEGTGTKCLVLDHRNNLAPHKAQFKNGTLELVKPDFHSAAFFVSFGE